MNNQVTDGVFCCHLDTISLLDLHWWNEKLTVVYSGWNRQMGGTNGLFVQIYPRNDYSFVRRIPNLSAIDMVRLANTGLTSCRLVASAVFGSYVLTEALHAADC
jgi:hypothetical protein